MNIPTMIWMVRFIGITFKSLTTQQHFDLRSAVAACAAPLLARRQMFICLHFTE